MRVDVREGGKKGKEREGNGRNGLGAAMLWGSRILALTITLPGAETE